MPTPVPARSARRTTRSRTACAAAAGALIAGALAVAAGPVAGPAQAAETTASSSSHLTMVHANILSQLSAERFQADVRTVMSKSPDLITYNEVPLRQDSVIAPSGYALQRAKRNRYTAATAVAWRTDRWTEVDGGTFRISNYRRVPRGRSIRLGLRFANWVTLQSADGRQLSVVAAHVPPLDRDMPDLVRPSVRRVGTLVKKLAPDGPVLVGGDFNVHYTSSRYPRDLFRSARMVPTYDALGTHFPTGDHRGATIDYIFQRGAGQLAVDRHSTFELKSDHDGLMAGLSWQVDAPADTAQLVSDPAGGPESQRVVLNALIEEVRAVPSGSQIDLVTSGFGPRRLVRQVKAAVDRRVQVRLTTRSKSMSRREQRLGSYVRAEGLPGSQVRRCRGECLDDWKQAGIARGLVVVRDRRGDAVKRMDVDRYLNPEMLARRTTLTVSTGSIGLTRGEEMLASIS